MPDKNKQTNTIPHTKIFELKPNRLGEDPPETAISFFGTLSSISKAPFFERLKEKHHTIVRES